MNMWNDMILKFYSSFRVLVTQLVCSPNKIQIYSNKVLLFQKKNIYQDLRPINQNLWLTCRLFLLFTTSSVALMSQLGKNLSDPVKGDIVDVFKIFAFIYCPVTGVFPYNRVLFSLFKINIILILQSISTFTDRSSRKLKYLDFIIK